VGTAHRCAVDETIPINNQRVIFSLIGSIYAAPVGDAHL
jgi:hypothetical protein